jgi:5'(3')-deoxyribonucleotidase
MIELTYALIDYSHSIDIDNDNDVDADIMIDQSIYRGI